MGQLTAAAKQAYRKLNAGAHLVLEADLPGGTLRWGRESLVSSLGKVDGRVLSFGEWPLGEAVLGGITEQNAQVVVADEDGALRDMLAGADANSVYRAATRLKLVPRGLSSADIHTLATGVLHDLYRNGRRSYNLVIRPNDYALASDFPEASLTAADWPLAVPDAYGQSYPLVYGGHSATAYGAKGQVPLICVDTTAAPAARWLVCMGRLKGVNAVYINGTVASGATYAFSYVTRNGIGFSTVLFSSAAPASTDTVTANVDGYETVGSGAGSTIQDPVACIRHLLNNFVFGRWKSGNWLGDHARLSTTAFNAADDFTVAHQWLTSKRFSGPQRKGTDALAEWLESLGFGAYWTRDGKLGIAPVDSHKITNIYPDDFIELDTDTTEPQYGPGFEAFLTRASAQFANSEAQGQYLRSLEVRNPRLSETIEESTQLPWSYTGGATDFNQTREILSRRLLARMNQQETVDFQGPLWLLDLDVNSDLGLVNPSGLEAEWGRKKWQRRLHRVQRMSLLGDTMQVRLNTRGLRKGVVNLWETMEPGKPANNTNQYADTLARLTNGQARTYARTGSAWTVEAGERSVVLVGANAHLYDAAGHIIERASLQYVTRSSFVSALTGWVTANTTADTADLFFESSVSANSAKLLSTGGAHATIQHTTPATVQNIRLSIDYKNDTAAVAIGFRLTRSSDGKFWRESDSTWQVGSTTNNMPLVATKDPDSRFVSKDIDLGGAGLTVTLIITTTAFSQTAHVYHVQVESDRHASSRIVTDGSTGTRSASSFTYANDTPDRIVYMDRGTIHLGGFISEWTGGESTNDHTMFLIDHGASDRALLWWDGTNNRWTLDITRSGAVVSATYATTVTRGTEYDFAVRWVSSEGELDLAPYRWTLFLDGVEVAAVTAGGTIAEAASSDFDILHQAGAFQGDGSYRHLLISPFAYSDAEIARLPL